MWHVPTDKFTINKPSYLQTVNDELLVCYICTVFMEKDLRSHQFKHD